MRYLAIAALLLLAACATTYAGGEPVYEDEVY
jgi:hypothetical protein